MEVCAGSIAVIVMGVDPSLRCTGWGVLDGTAPAEPSVVSYGQVKLPHWKVPERLATLYRELDGLLLSYRPDVVAWERPFVGANHGTAIVLGYAAGVVQLVAEQHGVPAVPYAPASVKKAVTGSGRASKEQVALVLQKRLSLASNNRFLTTDASDALAVAMTGYYWRNP